MVETQCTRREKSFNHSASYDEIPAATYDFVSLIFDINGNEFYLATDFCVLYLLCSSCLRFLSQFVFEAKAHKTVVSHEDRNFLVFSGFGCSGKGKNAHTTVHVLTIKAMTILYV